MKINLSELTLITLSISVAACGGGGGGSGPSLTPPGSGPGAVGPPVTQTTPTPMPTTAPTTAPTGIGIQAGATFTFTGALSRSDIYNYPVTNPFPDGTVNAQISQNASVSDANNPFGSGTALDYRSVEQDAYQLQTLQSTTDSFYELNQAGSTANLFLLGSKTTDDQHNLVTITYKNPQLIFQFPEAAGQSWTNNPDATIDTDNANGNTSERHTGRDGTYSERDFIANVDGTNAQYPTVIVTAVSFFDGSASIVFLFNEEGRANFPFKSVTDTFLMSAPQTSGITLKASELSVPVSGTPPPSPAPETFGTAPTWFGTPLFAETDIDNGLVTIPTACNVPSQFGTQAFQIVRTIHTVDPAFGNVDDMTTTQFVVNGFGVVCAQISDVNNAFYDFSEATFTSPTPNGIFNFATSAAQPLIATTITEVLTLQSSGTGSSSQSRSMGLHPIAPASIAIAQLAVQRESALARMKRLRMQVQRMERALLHGGRVQ